MDSEVLWSARAARKPDMRGFFGAVAVQALCFGAAWWFGLNPYFMGGLCVYAVLGWVWRWRIEWLARPLAVQLSERAVRVVRRRFWGGERVENYALAEFFSVASYMGVSVFGGTDELRTVLLHADSDEALTLDWQPARRQGRKFCWLQRRAPAADSLEAAALRAEISEASGLPDCGFIDMDELKKQGKAT